MKVINFEMVTSTPSEQRIVLQNISWQTFEALLRNRLTERFAYDCGTLEIMTPLYET